MATTRVPSSLRMISIFSNTFQPNETQGQPRLANGASGKRCDIDGKPERVSIGSMRIKARLAISVDIFIMRKGGNKPARRPLQRLVRPSSWLQCGREAVPGARARKCVGNDPSRSEAAQALARHSALPIGSDGAVDRCDDVARWNVVIESNSLVVD